MNKFAKYSGDWLERERTAGASSVRFSTMHPLQRFCETCQRSKPKNGAPAVKGWKCNDCTLSLPSKV